MKLNNAIGKLWYKDLCEAEDFRELVSELLKRYPSFENELEIMSRFDNLNDDFSAANYLISVGRQEEAIRVINFCKPFREELEKNV